MTANYWNCGCGRMNALGLDKCMCGRCRSGAKVKEFEITKDIVFAKNTLKPTTDEEKLNNLEKAWYQELQSRNYPFCRPHCLTLKLANRCRYTPDFICWTENMGLVAYETKGRRVWEDSIIKLKVVANQYRWITFVLVKRDKTTKEWVQQIVKP